jgi:predicted phage-related endonuclease
MATILRTADVVSAKATTETVNKVSRYAEVKALIANLEKEETQLKADILEAFGEATLLTHRNLEVARLDERTRTTNDSKKLAELFPEAYEATKRATAYKVIINIFR